MVFTILVLIETLWNVKDKTTLDFGATVSVLIETLWNVKFTKLTSRSSASRINRNIVECKGI